MAKSANIQLEIVTPGGICLSEEVESLTAPSVEGEFGVLPGHQPLLAALKTGIVAYVKGNEERRVAVGPGFVEVLDDRALLLTDRFTSREDVDPVQTRLELREADEALDGFDGEPGSTEHVQLVCRELWAAVRLELYGDPPPPTYRSFSELLAVEREDYVKAFRARSADVGSSPAADE
jgi:F-type H+-transporting ATPase subunit epsilon